MINNSLFFEEQPLVVNRTLARLLGLNSAIVLQQVHYWLKFNEKSKKNFHDGKYWTFNTIAQWHQDNFDFWSYDTVKRTFAKLEEMGLLQVGNYNKESWDRTKWYTIDYQKLEGMHQCNSANCTKVIGQNAPMDSSKLHHTIPETTSEITPEINIINTDVGEDVNNALNLINGETEKADYKIIKDYFCKNIQHQDIIPYTIEQQLYEFYKVVGVELVKYAIDKACEYRKDNFSYVKGILNNLINNNITTVEQAEKQKPNKKPNKQQKELSEDEIYDYIFS